MSRRTLQLTSLTFMVRSLGIIACLVLALPAASQPLQMTSRNGCDLWIGVGGEMELQPPFGSGGSLQIQKVSTGQLATFDFECVDFPPGPPVGGVLHSVSMCNWRIPENGVKGTTRVELEWFPDTEVPGLFAYVLNGQIIRGTRYPTGVTSAQGLIDTTVGTITADTFFALLCKSLGH